ncbi:MAG: MBOAT family O-acyltransferase [bacterium]
MLFNSLEFLIFFPLVCILYFLIPHKFRPLMLLVASCLFYMAFIPSYILILAFTIIVDYFAGRLIAKSEGRIRKIYLLISLLANIGVLVIFKYSGFISANINLLAKLFDLSYPLPILDIILPIGLSFHTFQAMSYTIEVYKEKQEAEINFVNFAVYVMFFPQLVAGPIERPQNLLHQFYELHNFEYQKAADGLKLIVWGMFKKVVIADRLAVVVNNVYNSPTDFIGPQLLLATVFFAFQIYCDFSGYSDIAVGSARVLGFSLTNNFNRPYHSKSISEFWRRWHISLSTWFRDYVYIPLGGSRVKKCRWEFNLFVTFIISGLWHGANWTFVIWGGLHAFYYLFSIWTKKFREFLAETLQLKQHIKLNNLINVTTVFTLVCVAWIFFRSQNIDDALYILTHLTTGFGELFNISNLESKFHELGISRYEFLIVLGSIAVMEYTHFLQRNGSIIKMLYNKPLYFRWVLYYGLVVVTLLFGVYNKSQFIYFQF